MFGNGSHEIESRINRLYQSFKSTAEHYHYTFQRPQITPKGRPNVIFLGNHSSGKSTFINQLLGEPAVQDTGVAPTDDGFTVILFGTTEQDYFGPAAVGQLPIEFARLADLGPAFLQHLQVKFRNRPYLQQVNLIDSPGMIDTAEGHATRSYPFTQAVRQFAELSDLVFFLFDPEKPGTTAEAVSVLSQCMFGIEFKLRVLLNKADTFDSMYDFARTYGTLCWNLARVLHMKDLPTIYTTYTPQPGSRINTKVSLDGFDRHRAKILNLLQGLPQRRFDSLLANVTSDFTRLALQSRVLQVAASQLALARIRQCSFAVLSTLAAGLLTRALCVFVFFPNYATSATFSWQRILTWMMTILLVGVTGFISALFVKLNLKRFRAHLSTHLDAVFEKEYAVTLATGARQDLREYWASLRADLAALIQSHAKLPLLDWGTQRRLTTVLRESLPELTSKSRKEIVTK